MIYDESYTKIGDTRRFVILCALPNAKKYLPPIL